MDAIAAGGGLAGNAFALELARAGAGAMVIERTSAPHHKVCGDFLSGETKTLLRHLGLETNSLGGSKIGTLSLADRTSEAQAPLPFDGLGLSRFRLDEALLQEAVARGVTVLRGVTVEGIEPDGNDVVVRTTSGSYRSRAVALASGKHNVRGIGRLTGSMTGFKMHLEPARAARASLCGVVRLVAFRGGYVGLCIVEDGILSVAWNIENAVLQSIGASWTEQSAYFSSASQHFADLVSGARPLWDKPLAISGLPYGYLRTAPIAQGIYPIGDQLAVIPSFAGDGTALALASGIAAARAWLEGENACVFQRRLVAQYRAQFRLVGAIDRVIASPVLRRIGIAIAKHAPGIVTKLASATRLRGVTDIIGADGTSA